MVKNVTSVITYCLQNMNNFIDSEIQSYKLLKATTLYSIYRYHEMKLQRNSKITIPAYLSAYMLLDFLICNRASYSNFEVS